MADALDALSRHSDSEFEALHAAAVDSSRVADLADAKVDVVQDGGQFVGMLDALPAHSDSESEALSSHLAAAGTARVVDLSEAVSDFWGRRDPGFHKEVLFFWSNSPCGVRLPCQP